MSFPIVQCRRKSKLTLNRFPKMTMETIKEALSSQFAQVGSKKAEKKWVFVSAS